MMDRLGTTGRLALGVLVLAVGWIALQTGALSAVAEPLLANLPIVSGLALIGLLGYWLIDEADEDDDVVDAVDSAGDRAADASRGFINFATVAGGAFVAVLATTGDQLVDLLLQAPGIFGQVVLGGLGVGAALGAVPFEAVVVGLVVVVVVTLLAAERGAES